MAVRIRTGAWAALIALAVMATALLPAPGQAQTADSFAELVRDLGAKSYSAKIRAVNKLAATGDDRAADILQAMVSRNLYSRKSDKRIFIGRKKGTQFEITDPITRKVVGVAEKSDLSRLRVNNRLRRTVRTALGALTLASKNPQKRLVAAQSIFKSPKAAQIDILRSALKKETDDEVLPEIVRALGAAELLHGKTSEIRIAAIGALGVYTDRGVSALLKSVVASKADATIRAAAQTALDDIEERVFLWELLGQLFTGLSLGSVLLLAAIGLAITFGVMGVINMAHGEMVMIGAYTTFVVQEVFRSTFPQSFDLSLAVAIPMAFLVAGAFGVAIERGVIRYLYGRPLETLLATWGISLILQQMVRTIFGPTNKEVGNPSWMSGAIELDGGVLLTYNRIWIIVFSLMVVVMLALILKKTALGLQMRAVTQNRRMANAMGIRTGRVDAMTFGLGSGVAGMGGVALSQIDNVSPNLGQAYIVDSFMVVVFGGVGNLLGTLLGATSLGIANKFLEAWSGAVLAKILILIAVILFIQKRPSGLFALKGRAAEG
ncbi:MAG: urea transport system permease protein [Paracoccaceae bacterium]|jgi:urea transport system permease protein